MRQRTRITQSNFIELRRNMRMISLDCVELKTNILTKLIFSMLLVKKVIMFIVKLKHNYFDSLVKNTFILLNYCKVLMSLQCKKKFLLHLTGK